MENLIRSLIRYPRGTSVKKGTDEEHDAVVKLLQDWKPPQVPLYDVYQRKGISSFLGNIFNPKKGNFESKSDGYAIKTVEKTVSIQNEGEVEFELHASSAINDHKRWYDYLHKGLVQVGVKPLTRNGLNTSVLVCLRDARLLRFQDSLLAAMESSLSDGPVYFNCYPNYSVSLTDPHILDTLKLYVRTHGFDEDEDKGSKHVAIFYRVYYKVMTSRWFGVKHSKVSDSTGRKTTFIQTNLLKDNVAVANTMEWDSIEVPDGVETRT